MAPKGDAMRYAVLVLGLLGALGSAYLSHYLFDFLANPDPETKLSLDLARELAKDETGKRELTEPEKEFNKLEKTAYCLLAGIPLAIAAGLVALMRQGLIASLLMFFAAAVPAIFNLRSLIFTSPLLLGGLLALFVWPQKSAGVLQEVG
jgi:hypothetical protein